MRRTSLYVIAWTVICVAALCAAFAVVYWLHVTLEDGQRMDAASLGATALVRDQRGELTDAARRGIPLAAAAAAAVTVLIAFVRGRRRDAVVAALLPVVAYALAAVLRDLVLPRPYLGEYAYLENTLPSGHVVVTVSCLVVIAWLLPAAIPGSVVVLIAALVTGAAGLTQVAAFAHRFADVVAGALLVGVLAAAWPMRRRQWHVAVLAGWIVVGAVAIVAGTWLLHRWDAAGYPPHEQAAA
ncbi:MAG: phosphatase PAP2 family protein, partial [Demequina sp.]